MMKHAVRVTLWMVTVVLVSAPAMAQVPQWTDRGFVFGNLVFQIQSDKTVTSTATPTVYDETATLDAAQSIKGQGVTFDLGAGIRVAGNFGIGAAFSQISTTGQAVLAAEVPHPLVYDLPRTATGTATGLTHREQQIHVFAIWMVPVSEKMNVGVYGGPTFFRLKQDIVALGDPPFTEDGSPYTSVTMNTSQSQVSASKVGFNVGGDVAYRLNETLGIGGFARYTRANVSVTPGGASPFEIPVGGLQIGGGLRIFF